MSSTHIIREIPIVRSPRVLQLEGIFEVSPSEKSRLEWNIDLPLADRPWSIGLIVGPSGSGKTTIARDLFPDDLVTGFAWPEDNAIVDGFPKSMSIKDITMLLSSIGFSSPPSWLRPFHCLSNGEQFRVTIARALAESRSRIVIDEFTSVIDRTVAQIGCVAIAKAIRKSQRQFVGVSCHYDIEEWLQPDWIYDVGLNDFRWRSLRRHPTITLDIIPCDRQAWQLFRHHHYLDTKINSAARCFLGSIKGTPVVFSAVLSLPHPTSPGWRGHRTVCLPDFQGVGIGVRMAEFVASIYAATGKPFTRTTSNPAIIAHHAKSTHWYMSRGAGLKSATHSAKTMRSVRMAETSSNRRITASFRYVGPIRWKEAVEFGVITPEKIPTSRGQDGREEVGHVVS